MSKNANPDPVLTPRLIVSDSGQAIAFYQQVFGAEQVEHYKSPDGMTVHAAISIDGAIVSLADEAPDWGNISPDSLGGSAVLLRLSVSDPDATARAAEEAGATIVIPVADQFYGHREGRIKDPFGHLWIVGKAIAVMTSEQIQQGIDSFGKAR